MSTSSKSKSDTKIDRSSVRKTDNGGSRSSKSSSSLPSKSISTKTDRKSIDLTNATIKTQSGKVVDSNSQKHISSSSEKGILKNKKSARSGEQTKKKEKVKKAKPRKKTLYEKTAQWLGFYVGNVVLKDPRALEAAQALDLHQNHLRRLRLKFDKIDIDNSGNIDYDEFFESVGETRSPFTDKLFSLIGQLDLSNIK
jgi:hypothetical protein